MSSTGILRIHTMTSSQCLDSSIGRALHRYRRGHGFESHSSPNFFRLSFRNCIVYITAMIIHLFILSSAVQIYEFSYIHFHHMSSTGSTAPVSQRSWVRIPFKPGFFQAFFSQLRCVYNCDDHSFIQSLKFKTSSTTN